MHVLQLTGVGMSGGLGDGPFGVALGQVAADDDLLPLVLEVLGHRAAGDRPRLVEGLRLCVSRLVCLVIDGCWERRDG